MATQTQLPEATGISKKRKSRNKKGHRAKKIAKGIQEKVKVDKRMKKLFRKRAREYNSDDDDDVLDGSNEITVASRENAVFLTDDRKTLEPEDLDDDGLDVSDHEEEEDEEEDGEVQPGITKLTEGSRAFRNAFKSIIKKSVSDESLGPVLSAHKKLIAKKLAAEEEGRKVKGDAKKEKQLVVEKGHVKPANYLDVHEKFLISVATKGVVKLFNAVNKAQNAQKGLNPSRTKDVKVIKKRRKEAFFSELSKPASSSAEAAEKIGTSSAAGATEPPGWAPLRDNYMLTSSKLKNWDKMQEASDEDARKSSEDGSSDDD